MSRTRVPTLVATLLAGAVVLGAAAPGTAAVAAKPKPVAAKPKPVPLVPPHGTPVVANATAPTAGRCAPATTRSFTGTVTGGDGLDLDATVGFDIKDRAGHPVDLATGCPTGAYGALVVLNPYTPFDGSPPASLVGPADSDHSANAGAPGVTTNAFVLANLPANAATTYIEVWPRGYIGHSCCDSVNLTKYGPANRRLVPMNRPVSLRAPVTPAYGGTTGTIAGRVVDRGGRPVVLAHVYAWSQLTPDGSLPFQGWGIGTITGTGTYRLPALAPGQPYVVEAIAADGRAVFSALTPVRARATTPLTLRIG